MTFSPPPLKGVEGVDGDQVEIVDNSPDNLMNILEALVEGEQIVNLSDQEMEAFLDEHKFLADILAGLNRQGLNGIKRTIFVQFSFFSSYFLQKVQPITWKISYGK